MTEEEWFDERKVAQLLMRFLLHPGQLQRTKRGKRKLRFYSCACCRVVWQGMDDRSRDLVDSAELLADSKLIESKADLIRSQFSDPTSESSTSYGEFSLQSMAIMCWHRNASEAALESSMVYLPLYGSLVNHREANQLHCDLVRDIFGNPFQPVPFDPSWRTSTAVAIAKGMYDSRDFSAMPILADALQDAGCEHAGILDHCHGSGPHVKGCWVVDLVLGKE